MSRPIEVPEKVGYWKQAYDLVRPEFTNSDYRDILDVMMTTVKPDGDMRSAEVALAMARMVAANDRAAGLIAAMLTSNGIRPVPLPLGDENV